MTDARSRLRAAIRAARPPTVPTGDPAFGAVLQGARTARGLSQIGLGRLIGIHHTHVSRLETGDRSVSRAVAQRLADVLGDEVMIRAGFLPAGYVAVKEDAP